MSATRANEQFAAAGEQHGLQPESDPNQVPWGDARIGPAI